MHEDDFAIESTEFDQPDSDQLYDSGIRTASTLTYGTANAKFLLTRDPTKIDGLARMLHQLHLPDLFVVTELGRASGTNARDWLALCGIDEQYQAVWTNRSLSKSGDAADATRLVGGGVMLMVHRRLCAQISEVKVQLPADDMELVRGHLGVWRLDPSASTRSVDDAKINLRSLRCPLVVTAAYIPPNGSDWNQLASDAIFSAIEEYERVLLDARRSLRIDHVVIGHFNARCSTLPVQLRLSDGDCRLGNSGDVASYCQSLQNKLSAKLNRAELSLVDGRLILQPRSCNAAQSINDAGRRLIDIMQRHSMCPTSGVLNHCMPTTWIQCNPDCPGRALNRRNRCDTHSKMVNVNDLVFVDADLIVKALLSPQPSHVMKLVSRRIMWTQQLDHAVTYGHFQLSDAVLSLSPPVAASVAASDPIRRQCRRLHLPFDKRRRLHVRRLTGEMLNEALIPSTKPTDSLSERDAAFVKCAKISFASALRRVPQTAVEQNATEPAGEALSWRQLWRCKWREHRDLQNQISKGLAAPAKLAELNKQLRQLFAQKQNENRYRRSRAVSASVTAAPKLHWKLLRHNIQDPGEPAEARCKLLHRLNDKDGKLITTDKQEIRRHLLEHRKEVFSIRSDLSDDALKAIRADIDLVHSINTDLMSDGSTLSPDSFVSQSTLDPIKLWRGSQPLLHPSDSAESNFGSATARKNIADLRRRRIVECTELEAEFSFAELDAVLDGLEDTGPGIDGVAVGSLTHLDADSKHWLLNFFNEIWRTGVLPQSWSEIRVVLHYKGKGSDPFCADNYRGLGIGAALEKILSLMMMKRLEKYLMSTKSLHSSQGGFLPQRGPPEQVFTLSEAVRAELKKQGAAADPVHLCFIDIERAYDSVQHVKLWARCAEMGIGGRFLSTLQAMYAGKKAVLDVDGELLEPHDIECGVLQGNPLSPLLFNIYIDKVLREIDIFAEIFCERLGSSLLPLPLFNRDGTPKVAARTASTGRRFPSAVLTSLFFADDGVLIARDRVSMQQILNHLVRLLDRICLKLNARKTKMMIVPRLSASEKSYQDMKKAVADAGGYSACGREIEIVDEFMYLGVCIWYGWDWSRAWHTARRRACRMLYALRQAGVQNQPVPLVYQLRFAASQVLSHLDYVSAIAGVEGTGNEEIAQCELIVNQLLRLVTGCHMSTCTDAMMAESGTWDFRTRMRMLQLRLFTKLTMMDSDSTHFRAMCLSRMQSADRAGGRLRYYTWFDSVRSSSACFDAHTHDPNHPDEVVPLVFATSQLQPIQSLVRVERLGADGESWTQVEFDDGDVADQVLRVRAVHNDALRIDYSTGAVINTWQFPPHTSVKTAWSAWSMQMREAAFAELRLRGNKVRQSLFGSIVTGWASQSSGQRDYAPLKATSYLEPYWFADDPHAARCLLRARIGYSKLEFDYRRSVHHYPRASSSASLILNIDMVHFDSRRTIMPKLELPHDRACYMCPHSDWLPETISHALQKCTHPLLVAERAKMMLAMTNLIDSSASLAGCPTLPDLHDDCSQLYLLQLATSVGPIHHRGQLAQHGSAGAVGNGQRRSARLAQRRALQPVDMSVRRQQSQWLPLKQVEAATAVKWTSFFTSEWRRAIARGLEHDNPSAAIGKRLVNLVVTYHRRIISLRRQILQNDAAFLRRVRDPVQARPQLTTVT